MKKSIKYSIAAAALGVATIATFGVGSVMAQATGTSNPVDAVRNQVFEKVVSKLNLNVTPTQLKDAMESSRKEVMTANFKETLSKAVTDGKITQDIADKAVKIMEARETLKDTMTPPTKDELDNLTRAEIKAKMDENRTKMEKALSDATSLSTDEIKSVQEALRKAEIFVGPMGNERGMHKGGRGGEFGKNDGMMRGDL